jgi:hypothetical protein
MKAVRQLLSDTLAIFLRLSACNTASSYPQADIFQSSHRQPFDRLTDQPSAASDDQTSLASTMSLQPYIITPSSYFQSHFDLTLIEYSKLTGIDLTTHRLASAPNDKYSVDSVINTSRERIRASNDPQTDDSMTRLRSQLKSIAHIASLLSPREVLIDYIDPV